MSVQKKQEQMLRRRLQKAGYVLHKSRVKNTHADDFGGYMIEDVSLNAVVSGSRFELNLDDVEDFVQNYA